MFSHSGRNICKALDELQSSFDIFKDAVSDFLQAAQHFHEQSGNPIAWRNLDEGVYVIAHRKVLKELFAASASSMALVEHTRRLVNSGFTVLSYEEEVARMFNSDGLHELIQGLRNYFLHRKVLPLGYKLASPRPGNISVFFLPRGELLAFDNWKAKAREYIEQQSDEIEVEATFHVYRDRVCKFHNWFIDALKTKHREAIAGFRAHEHALKIASIRGAWHRLVAIATARGIDPYKMLPSVLTEEERQEVLSLDIRSRQQVDRIIEMFDHHGACDASLRQKIYKLFSASN